VSNNLTTKLDKTGGNMNGDINMGNNKSLAIIFLIVMKNWLKKYIDSLTPSTLDVISINSKVNKSGDTMTGHLNMGIIESSSYVQQMIMIW